MKGSLQRVRAFIHGEKTDRAPLYDLLRNDAVIEHFTGEKLTIENAERVVFGCYDPAIDATRPMVRLPRAESESTLPDGRQERVFRWTVWTSHKEYADSDAYAAAKRAELRTESAEWTAADQASLERFLASTAEHRRKLGEVFFFPGMPGISLMSIYGEVGLEQFSYHLADHPGLIEELMERNTRRAIRFVERLPSDHGIEAAFVGDDIAFKTGSMLAPSWFGENYFHRFARVCAAYHQRGIKVLFHSDGNLYALLDGLVEAGIDGLNPIEVLAGMDVAEIHRRYPTIFMAGGIDVSQLLPFGKPQEIKDAVHRAIDAAEGRLMVGSSTELHADVPLGNFLAMREAVLDYRY